jgi:hypothetical protein
MTKVAWETKKDEIEQSTPGITRERFIYRISRADFERDWGKRYQKPGPFDKTLALFFRIVPKVGPLSPLSFKTPTPEAERLFIESFNVTLNRYRAMLSQARTGKLDLQNKDFDTGEPTRAGEYKLADETYAKLLNQLASKNFDNVPPALRANILAFYGNLNAPIATKKDREDWQKTLRALDKLKATPTQATRTGQRP